MRKVWGRLVKRRGDWRIHVAWAISAIVAVAATWIAATVVLSPAATLPADAQPQTYTVVNGEVGETTAARATVAFIAARSVPTVRDGVITTIPHAADAAIDKGTVLATIDMRPVVVAPGAVPAYRDMAPGMRGLDIAQLRSFLEVGDGDTFDPSTEQATRAWQAESGFPVDGVVGLGDLVFVPELPARGSFADGVAIGAQMAPGAPLFDVVEARPRLLIPADANARIRTGMAVRIALPDGGEAVGTLSGPFQSPDGLQSFHVLDADGRSTCDEACAAQFDVEGAAQIVASIETVPTVEGLIVPDSALVTRPDGSLAVRTLDGELVGVSVDAQGAGLSVVSGIEEGSVIRLFDDDQGTG